ncbi:hypothetical protein PSHT_07268 [Puccinia striiformis]|nr:hypothetical protein PSHT_07268 [Puccinia striiformis]
MLFNHCFSTHVTWISELIQLKFNNCESHLKSLQPQSPPVKDLPSNSNEDDDSNSDCCGEEFNFYPKENEVIDINTELERYKSRVFPMDKKGCVLGWWKVHCKDFPTLGLLARDYLACAASSACVELSATWHMSQYLTCAQ